MVAVSIPPNTVNPIVLLAIAPAPVAKAKGNTPSIKAIEVIIIGLKRSFTAAKVAGTISIPPSTLSLANSTIKIAFLAAKPINVTKPICAYTLLVKCGRKVRVSIAPNAPIGTDKSTEKGTDQLSYSAARNKKTKRIDKEKI